jgi:hypothetical protein
VTGSVLPSSFRDPSGFVFRHDGRLYRQVNAVHREHYELLMSSGLYEALTSEGLLVRHRDAPPGLEGSPEAYKVIEPDLVSFISYPYEWSFGELKDAALLTLRVQQMALDHGMSLRDSSAYNVQFRDGKPILIDTLSFERLPEGRPWVGYAQFCQHFVAPLALMRYRDVRLGQLLRVHIDGAPLDLAAGLLPFRARLRPGLLLHLFLHARSQRKHAGEAVPPPTPSASAEAKRRGRPFSLQAFRGLIQSLEKTVSNLHWDPGRTVWNTYYGEAGSYSDAGLEHKRALVEDFVRTVSPGSVWDLGANTGMFSRIASSHGASTVSFDVDPACVEANYRAAVSAGETGILPLVVDLANPSPSLGWANAERMSLLERGPVDLVLALALVHHLAIANNVPLPMLASFLHEACHWLVVEFVPKSDAKVQLLLASREDIFPGYTVEGFETAFQERFVLERREPVKDSDRILYLMRER